MNCRVRFQYRRTRIVAACPATDHTTVVAAARRGRGDKSLCMKSQQQSLFELDPAPWELDDASEQLVATVVFPTGPEQPFDYRVPRRVARPAVDRPARAGPLWPAGPAA